MVYFCYMVLVAQLCPTLCNPMDCSPPGFSVHGILQERILEWVTWAPPRKALALLLQHTAPSIGSAVRGENIACLLLWPPCQPGERLCCVYAIAVVQKEWTFLQFLRLLESSSSLLAHVLPTLSSVNTMNSNTVSIVSMISKTDVFLT